MYLGIEIGGTKLQLGVGTGDGSQLAALDRQHVDPKAGAAGNRAAVEQAGKELLAHHPVQAVGIGFGGPVDAEIGRTITSHQISGWDSFPLVQWCRDTFGLPAVLANDADTAGLAEARFGAGRGEKVVFYITVASGIGGALILGGQIYSGSAGVGSELAHLRPGVQAEDHDQTLESVASGWGITARVQARLAGGMSHRLALGADSPRPAIRKRSANG